MGMVRRDILVLFLVSIRNGLIKYGVSCWFFHRYIKLRKFLCIPSLLVDFMLNGCWILSDAFSISVDMIICFFFPLAC